ncbi:hypothetical protein OEZ83_25995, partial [Leclercia adecarboxylata]|uniref:hypothetical protein n=1 Tax=Leclercia adecarboxylata TaxID=83655 RepID=UPI00234D1735
MLRRFHASARHLLGYGLRQVRRTRQPPQREFFAESQPPIPTPVAMHEQYQPSQIEAAAQSHWDSQKS